MQKEIKTEIIIEAAADKVWNILIDFQHYGEWNPFIQSISGEPKVGAKLQTFIQPPDAGGMTFTPTLLIVEENQELRWLGKLFFGGLFDGEHRFFIEMIDQNRVRFIHSEKFSGLLIPLFGSTLKRAEQGFELMNQALKARAEKQQSK
jgi:hypothetical protein